MTRQVLDVIDLILVQLINILVDTFFMLYTLTIIVFFSSIFVVKLRVSERMNIKYNK